MHRELKFKDIAPIIVKAAITTGTVIIILGFATAFARYITMMQVPQLIGEAILQVTNNATIILCFFVVLILISGMFIENRRSDFDLYAVVPADFDRAWRVSYPLRYHFDYRNRARTYHTSCGREPVRCTRYNRSQDKQDVNADPAVRVLNADTVSCFWCFIPKIVTICLIWYTDNVEYSYVSWPLTLKVKGLFKYMHTKNDYEQDRKPY